MLEMIYLNLLTLMQSCFSVDCSLILISFCKELKLRVIKRQVFELALNSAVDPQDSQKEIALSAQQYARIM